MRSDSGTGFSTKCFDFSGPFGTHPFSTGGETHFTDGFTDLFRRGTRTTTADRVHSRRGADLEAEVRCLSGSQPLERNSRFASTGRPCARAAVAVALAPIPLLNRAGTASATAPPSTSRRL
jgi:hypothetical protein